MALTLLFRLIVGDELLGAGIHDETFAALLFGDVPSCAIEHSTDYSNTIIMP